MNDYQQHRQTAVACIESEVEKWATLLGVTYTKVVIKNHKRRWGSCSSLGNLNFNYRLLYLPECLRDYIIVHELCHRKQFNHSHAFWFEISLVLPNYRERVFALRQLERATKMSPELLRQHQITHNCPHCQQQIQAD